MSADNWADCPKCSGKDSKKLADAYGKVSLAQYKALEREVREESHDSSLREDYSVGIYKGVFRVSYRAECRYPGQNYDDPHGCGFSFEYEYTETIK